MIILLLKMLNVCQTRGSCSIFQIEFSQGCVYDSVVINDYGSEVGRFCGNETPNISHTSSSNFLTIIFSSDGSITDQGFELEYKVCPCKF